MNKEELIKAVNEIKADADDRLKRLQDGIKEVKENRRTQTEEQNR